MSNKNLNDTSSDEEESTPGPSSSKEDIDVAKEEEVEYDIHMGNKSIWEQSVDANENLKKGNKISDN